MNKTNPCVLNGSRAAVAETVERAAARHIQEMCT